MGGFAKQKKYFPTAVLPKSRILCCELQCTGDDQILYKVCSTLLGLLQITELTPLDQIQSLCGQDLVTQYD